MELGGPREIDPVLTRLSGEVGLGSRIGIDDHAIHRRRSWAVSQHAVREAVQVLERGVSSSAVHDNRFKIGNH